MKKILIIISSIVVIAIILAAYFNTKNNNQSTNTQQENSTASDKTANHVDTTQTQTQAGSYVDYYDGIIQKTSGTKVLFFHAPWCPQCKALDASIKAGKISDNVTIIKVDYDSSSELKKKYGVTLQTTLVRVDDEGKLIKKYVAYSTPSLDALISNVL